MNSPYMNWRVCDVMKNSKARGFFFSFLREEFPGLDYLSGSRAGWIELLRTFAGVKKLHECELSVRDLYLRIEEWSPGEEYYEEE